MSLRAFGLVCLSALALLCGCSAPSRDASEEREVGYLSTEDASTEPDHDAFEGSEGGDAGDGPGSRPGDTASDPYAKRAGTAEDDEEYAPPSRVEFQEPASTRSPVSRDRRPDLPEPARLAVVSVREGQIEHLPAIVLSLQTLLYKEREIKSVLNLGAPRLASVGLKDLAAQAQAEGRDLLLVDVVPGAAGAKRTGYLLDTKTGALLARYDVSGDSPPVRVSQAADADLCARLGRAYSRLRD